MWCICHVLIPHTLSLLPNPESYAHELVKLWFTVFTIILVAVVFTIAEVGTYIQYSIIHWCSDRRLRECLCYMQGLSELLKSDTLACHNLELFTHGGMIFLFTTSILFAIVSY